MKNKLKTISEKRALSQADKDFIVELSNELGVPFEPKATKCGNCYKDQAVILWRKLSEDDEKQYMLRPAIDVIFQNRRYNNTCTDEELAAALEKGLPRHLYAKIAGENVCK